MQRDDLVVPRKPSPLELKLDSWVAADLLDADQANAVLAYEAEHGSVEANRVPLAAEAVGYIGSGLVFASIALLIGNRWDDMSTPSRVMALAVPTAVAAAAGWWTGRSDEPALGRLGSVLWLLAVIGVAGTAAEIWVDAIHDGDPPDRHAALFIGSLTLLAAGAAWWRRRVELQQLALFGAAIATSAGILDSVIGPLLDRSMSELELAGGLVLVGLGVFWIAMGVTQRLPPVLLANLSGSVLVLYGTQTVREGNDHLGLWLGIGSAVALLVVGVASARLEILFVGTAGLFQWTPQVALFYLEDTLGAEATLFVIGVLLIAIAGGLTRIYPMIRARHRSRS